jgi:hypothetical protein
MITDYTTYADIRMALGLTSRELTDAQLAVESLELEFLDDLVRLGAAVDSTSNVVSNYATVYASSPAAGTAGRKFVSAVRVFAKSAVAFYLLEALPGLVPTYFTDSKAGVKKDLTSTFKDVPTNYYRRRSRLQTLYAEYLGVTAPAAVRMPLLTVSSPSSDPVTNE